MKKLLFSFIILAACTGLYAQQDHHYTQFMYNKMLYNPAYAGARGVPSVSGIFRQQWLGFEGAPQSFLASFNSPFLTPRVGVGVVLSHLKIGLQRDFHASLAYSYELFKNDDISVRAGIQGSIRSLGMDFDKANPVDPDPSVDNQRVSDILGNVGAGLYGTFMGRYYVGLSVPRIHAGKFGSADNQGALTIAKESPHFYATAGGIFPLSEDINLMPSILLKYVKNAPFDADINVNLDIRQKVTAGLSYRPGGNGPGESLDLLVLWQATPQIGVGAAYDLTLSDLKDYNSGSIELLFQADLKKSKKKNVFSPRFFM